MRLKANFEMAPKGRKLLHTSLQIPQMHSVCREQFFCHTQWGRGVGGTILDYSPSGAPGHLDWTKLAQCTTRSCTSQNKTITRSGSVLMGLIPPAATKFQVFPTVGQSQGQGHQVKNIGISKRSCHREQICNIKALSLFAQKLWPRLSFFKSRSKTKVKVTR